MGKVIRRGAEAQRKAVEIVKNGGSFEYAAAETGYCSDYVRQLCTKAKEHKTKSALVKERDKNVLDLIDKGYSVKEIADLVGCKSTVTIYETAERNGIRFSDKHKARKEKIISMRSEGFSISEIANTFGIKESCVVYACRGIAVPERKEYRTCERCGTAFECHPNSKQRFCTVRCSEAAYHEAHDIDRRQRKKKAIVDRDINLARVFEHDNGVCYICGNPCDFNDYIIKNGKRCACGNYPSIDHVIPLAKGGLHEWGNVRLAHIGCNSRKGIR